jgi:CO dehydrogenase maturation factor
VNQAQEAETEAVAATARQLGLEISGIIPEDHQVREYDRLGTPTIRLDEDNKAVQAAFGVFERIIRA